MQGRDRMVLFDGVCGLCSKLVQFVLRRDVQGQFVFVPFQSEEGIRTTRQLEIDGTALESIVLIRDGGVYRKSRAALTIARDLGGIWTVMYYLAAWIPPTLADHVYDFVGRNRYLWFERRESCWCASEDQEGRPTGIDDR